VPLTALFVTGRTFSRTHVLVFIEEQLLRCRRDLPPPDAAIAARRGDDTNVRAARIDE
jgi:hypothetical protein